MARNEWRGAEVYRRRRRPRWGLWTLAGAALLAAIVVPVYVYVLSAGKRVLLIGDSLMAQSAPAIIDDLGKQGFDVQLDAIPGSGLLDTSPNIDWPSRMRQHVADFNPDEVVVEFSGNYGFDGTRPGVVNKSTRFYQEWAAAAQQAEDILTSRRAIVYWVVGPPVRSPSDNQGIMILANIYKSLHPSGSAAGHPPTIDEFTPFSGPNGGYTQYGITVNGKVADLRTPDGAHFTLAGALNFAQAISKAVESGPKRIIQ